MKEFFDSLRSSFGPLSQNQVDGINHLLDATKSLPVKQRAYILATSFHETGPTSSPLHMTPRREIWGPTKAQLGYEGRADLGNTVPGDGKRYMGRGYVQITGRRNYKRASDIVGVDLVANPDMALEPAIAAKIIVSGMTNGWFTGKRMADYTNYRDMRRVVNGTDKADLIAGYAEKFEEAIKKLPADVPSQPVPEPEKPVLPVDPVPPTEGPKVSIAAVVIGAVGALVAALAAWVMKG